MQPLTEAEIRRLLKDRPASELLRKNSARYKDVVARKLSDDALVAELAKDPDLVKRPIIVAGGEVLIGFDEKTLSQALG